RRDRRDHAALRQRPQRDRERREHSAVGRSSSQARRAPSPEGAHSPAKQPKAAGSTPVKKTHRRTIDLGSEKGQSLTEFALALPILARLLFAVIQFGITFNNYVTLTDATRAGARKAAVGRQLPNPQAATVTAVRKSASDLTQNKLGVTVSSTWQPGADVAVTATYPYSISLLGMVVKSGTLSSTTTERVE